MKTHKRFYFRIFKKRIALLLKLKWEESKRVLVLLGGTISIAWGFVLLLKYYEEFILTLLYLILGFLLLMLVIQFSYWIYSNWQEVKRRIP